MAISKVVLNGTTLMDATTATAAAEDITAPKTAMLADGVVTTGTGSGSGSSTWSRPAEWPDYSKLKLEENETEAIFFTYDNRNPPTTYGLNCYNAIYDRVRIENDGNVTVLESGITNHGTFTSEMGDYVCVRAIPQSGKHITGANMEGGSASSDYFGRHRCLERYGYLPYCTTFGVAYSYREWNNSWVQSDTLLKIADTVSHINYRGSYGNSVSLKNLVIKGNPTITWASFAGTNIDHLPNVQFSPVSTNNNIPLFFNEMQNIASLDLSNVDYSGVVGNGSNQYQGGFTNCQNLRWVRMPSNMNNMTVGIYDTFNGCNRLEIVEFDSSYSQLIGVRTFSGCNNMQALILRSNTVIELGAPNAVDSFMVTNGGYTYVPSNILEDYKAATNWSNFTDFILPIEGSYWETHHADGSLIE